MTITLYNGRCQSVATEYVKGSRKDEGCWVLLDVAVSLPERSRSGERLPYNHMASSTTSTSPLYTEYLYYVERQLRTVNHILFAKMCSMH